jgi:hypothetical protein
MAIEMSGNPLLTRVKLVKNKSEIIKQNYIKMAVFWVAAPCRLVQMATAFGDPRIQV